MAINEKIIP